MKLETIMRANAAFCLFFGAMFAGFPMSVTSFLSTDPAPAWSVVVIGIVLLLNGLHLLWVSTKQPVAKWEIYHFSAGDFGWVAGTVVMIAMQIWITTAFGIAAALGVAVIVGSFGILQLSAYRSRGV